MPKRPMNVDSSRKRLENAIETSTNIYEYVRDFCLHNWDNLQEGVIPPRTATKIVGLAFLGLVSGWEDFVEDSMVKYMCGGASECGYAPALRMGPCESRLHAYQVLGGYTSRPESVRISWSDPGVVRQIARIYFENGEPYDSPLQDFARGLAAATVLRNRVAHSSVKARRAFVVLSRDVLGLKVGQPLPRGFSPGRLLISGDRGRAGLDPIFGNSQLSIDEIHWGDYFELFRRMYLDLAVRISPRNIEIVDEIA